ncbi:MAG: ribonuclease P protein component, partial [Rhodospirillum sp.]|nr:ribonuclease P protein component [Rhodospirillum sp.]
MPSSQPDPALRFESFREDSEPPVESHRGKADTGPKEPGVKNPSAKILDPSDSSLIGRLKQRTDFLRVAGKRKKWAAPGLVLQVAPQPGATARRPAPDRPIRVGFTTSKKVGDAVDRNRA